MSAAPKAQFCFFCKRGRGMVNATGCTGACGLPLGWRARKLLPCAPRSSADLAPGHERRAPVPQHHLLSLGPSLRPRWMQPSLLSSVFFALSACACRSSDHVTVTSISRPSFVSHRGHLIQTIVLSTGSIPRCLDRASMKSHARISPTDCFGDRT